MKKISTLYKKNPDNLGVVINEKNPENEWVFNGEGIATRKFDGTAVAIINGEIYKRYDVKKGRSIPVGAIACQEPDMITEHHPHWVKCRRGTPEDKYFFEAFDALVAESRTPENTKVALLDGTYELCGNKVQSNREKVEGHRLIRHGSEVLAITDLSFEGLKAYLSNPENDIEGIVFHHPDGRMCKIRKSDFAIKR